MLGHRLAVDRRHDNGGTNTAFGADGTKQIGGIMAVVAHSQWSGTPLCPDMAQGFLLTDTGLIGEPHPDQLTGRPGSPQIRLQLAGLPTVSLPSDDMQPLPLLVSARRLATLV
jgi:hypothetical protein